MNIMTLGACLIVIGLLTYVILSHSVGVIIIIIGGLLILLSIRAAKRRAVKPQPITRRKENLTAPTPIQDSENPRVFFTHASRDKEVIDKFYDEEQ